jgi:hypothetical protein
MSFSLRHRSRSPARHKASENAIYSNYNVVSQDEMQFVIDAFGAYAEAHSDIALKWSNSDCWELQDRRLIIPFRASRIAGCALFEEEFSRYLQANTTLWVYDDVFDESRMPHELQVDIIELQKSIPWYRRTIRGQIRFYWKRFLAMINIVALLYFIYIVFGYFLSFSTPNEAQEEFKMHNYSCVVLGDEVVP